jgi:aryl-alcohol dehydrogenase-like predicted oxidoreductase
MQADQAAIRPDKTRPLSQILPSLILGGGSFSNQINPEPNRMPVRNIIKTALDLGFRAFDTSPYYGPSEELLGDALMQPDIANSFRRDEYILMTKVGRIAERKFDYSPKWVRFSVQRSLERLRTSYLDVVFCHDIEFVTEEEALTALGVLLELREQGLIRYVGISGYRLDCLVQVSRASRIRKGRPLDIVQTWAQLTLQNTRLLSQDEGLHAFRNEGVSCVCNSSPLGIGLLRSGGVPQGSLGDFHPAPAGLRKLALKAAQWVESQGERLSALSLRFSLIHALLSSSNTFRVSTITGVSSVRELLENVSVARKVFDSEQFTGAIEMEPSKLEFPFVAPRFAQLKEDQPLYEGVQRIFKEWFGWSFVVPEEGWWESKRI